VVGCTNGRDPLGDVGFDDGKTRAIKHAGVCVGAYRMLDHFMLTEETSGLLFLSRKCLSSGRSRPIQVVVLETLSPGSMRADWYDTADDE
jgi:hypothetical protein